MPITPTSTLSKNYQALGIDEIANDIETVFNAVNALPAAPTTATVNISSAQILAMGTTPIELLPDPTGLNYYDIDSITIEYTKGATAYSLAGGNNVSVNYGNTYKRIKAGFMGNDTYSISFIKDLMDDFDTDDSYVDYIYNGITGVYLTTWTGANPTLGNGTLRAIITYTTRTFGA